MKIQIVALGVLFAGALSLVGAEEGDANKPAKGEKGDKVSRFEALDTDKNGSLSMEEFTVNFEKRPARKVEGDKTLKTAEEVFAKMDTDKSGSLSPEEMKSGRKGKAPRREKKAVEGEVKE
ncbi:MAG: EF-hand domain-containing protein [Kiritimatiellia bacterium]